METATLENIEIICDECKETVLKSNSVNGLCRHCFIKQATRERVTFLVACGILGDVGIHEIRKLLDYVDFPANWQWKTQVGGKGEYVGSLSKRIAKFMYQEHKTKLSNDLLGKIGSVIGQHTNKQTEYTFDITKYFDWHSGDYGDSGSCYWGCRTLAREKLQDAGCLAIRFYDKEGCGYARAWLYPTDDEKKYIVFNGYGEESVNIARILSEFLSLSYRRITLENEGNDSGLIWINSGMGYAIGKEEDVNGFSYYDLKIDASECTCDGCECSCDEDEMTSVGGGMRVCESCLDSYSYCEDCDEYYIESTKVYYETNNGRISQKYVCDNCIGEYTKCEDCGDYFEKTITAHDDSGNEIEICNGCMESGYSYCEDCDEIHHNLCEVIKDGNEQYVCESCRDENFTECADCGKYFDKICTIKGKHYCESCSEEHTANEQLKFEEVA